MGATWSTAVNINRNAAAALSPWIAIDPADNINIVWDDNRTTNSDIFFCRSINNGTTWSTPVNASNTNSWAGWPKIVVDPQGNINIIWEDWATGDWEIYFTGSIR